MVEIHNKTLQKLNDSVKNLDLRYHKAQDKLQDYKLKLEAKKQRKIDRETIRKKYESKLETKNKNESVDIDQLREEIRSMQRWNILYKALKEELSAIGFWKARPRGNPSKGGKISWAKRNK